MYRPHLQKIWCLCCLLLCTGVQGCQEEGPVVSPPGYDLGNPQKFVLGESLREISGIVLLRGNSDTVYAIEDENGKLYYFRPGDRKYGVRRFGKRGDYEDIALLGEREFVILRSDGSLFTFPAGFVQDGNMDSVRSYERILPEGEYEGLYGDEGGSLIALCKNCPDDDQRSEVSAYVVRKGENGNLAVASHFKVDVRGVDLSGGRGKGKFRPSCLARHPLTGQWFIVSSVNKLLLVLDGQWRVQASYPLSPRRFKQPEGLTFDREGNMYISNEGQDGNANLLLFKYRQPK